MNNEVLNFRIREIVDMIDDGVLIIQPAYQRGYIWNISKKSKLIDSVLRGWIIPPIFCTRDRTKNVLEVIDGQQRLATIYSYYKGKFPDVEERYYDYLSKHYKYKFYNANIIFFVIDEFDQKTMGEYFFRLNDQITLTNVEKRNAYRSDFRIFIKEILHKYKNRGFNEQHLKLSNERLIYEDIISKLVICVDKKSLDIDFNEVLDDYYIGNVNIKKRTQTYIDRAMDEFCNILLKVRNRGEFIIWDKSNIFTLLFVLSIYPNKYKVNMIDFEIFLIDFERRRIELNFDKHSLYKSTLNKEKYVDLFHAYNYYSSKKAMTPKSMKVRELIIRILFFQQFEYLMYDNKKLSIEDELLLDDIVNTDRYLSIYDIEFILEKYMRNRGL